MIRLPVLVLCAFLLTACCSKRVLYEAPAFPDLKLYSTPDSAFYDLGTLVNEGEEICIIKWSTCIPTEEFIAFVQYIEAKNLVIDKYTMQAEKFNALLEEVRNN